MTIVNASRGTSKKYVDKKVADEVAAEANLRQNADTTLQSNIDAEASTRGNEDSRIEGLITTEVSTRGSEITRVEGLISTETSERTSADTTLQGNIDSESLTRASEITRVEGLITDEATTRDSEDSRIEGLIRDNATAITAEQTRAETAEQALNALIGDTNDYGTVTQAVLEDAKDYTDDQITQRVTQVYSVQGSCTYAQLASKTRTVGNVWNVTTANGKNIGDPDYVPPGTNYVCKGTNSVNAYDDWDAMGGSIDLSAYELTSSVNTKLSEYSKTTAINSVLEKHQNLIKRAQVTVKANDATVNGKVYNVTGVTGLNTEILIVSPVPASIQGAVDCGLYASASGNGTITFTSDIAPASNVTFDVTIISTAAGTQIS